MDSEENLITMSVKKTPEEMMRIGDFARERILDQIFSSDLEKLHPEEALRLLHRLTEYTVESDYFSEVYERNLAETGNNVSDNEETNMLSMDRSRAEAALISAKQGDFSALKQFALEALEYRCALLDGDEHERAQETVQLFILKVPDKGNYKISPSTPSWMDQTILDKYQQAHSTGE